MFRQRVNDWLSIILKMMAICIIVVGVLWVGLSIWGNIANSNDDPDPPDESKAGYVVMLHATRQTLYTNKVSDLGNGRYDVQGYYELIKNKWVFRDIHLPLDEYYFGDITIKSR